MFVEIKYPKGSEVIGEESHDTYIWGYFDPTTGKFHVVSYTTAPSFRKQGISEQMFRDISRLVKEKFGKAVTSFTGKPGDTNLSILTKGDTLLEPDPALIKETPWAQALDHLGFSSIYDPVSGKMISTPKSPGPIPK